MKFKYKITLCMILLMSVVFAAGGSALIATSFHASIEREKKTAYESFRIVANTLHIMGEYSSDKKKDGIVSAMQQFSEQKFSNWSAIRVTSSRGTEYFDGDVPMKNVAKSMNGAECVLEFIEDEAGKKYLQYSGYITYADTIILVDIAYDISPAYEMRDLQKATYKNIFAVMIVACAVLSYLLARFLTQPISSLSSATREIASGNLSYRAHIDTSDEIGIVASDFNNMAKQLEEKINEIEQTMERQEEFMGSFAHELKTPMTSVIGYADLIRSGVLEQQELNEAANFIFSEGKRLENLSFKLLDMLVLKKGGIKLKPASPSEIIKNLTEHLNPVYEQKNIILKYKCEKGTCMLEPDLVKSLLVNLIDNAAKAMEHGGNIFIVCRMTDCGCIIKVLDNGRGIPNEALEHLTEAFYRVDKSRARAQGGVGLGLSLCNNIVQLHNGKISFKNRKGGGACVTVELKGGRI